MTELLCWACAILLVAVVTLCVALKKTMDGMSTMQNEINFIFKDIKEIEERIDLINKGTLRILSEKVAELEERP